MKIRCHHQVLHQVKMRKKTSVWLLKMMMNEVSSCASLNEQNYSQLLEAFQETHDEANRLVLSNNRLKDVNSWLEKRVKSLEDEIEKSKNDFKNLENHFKNASCKCDTFICENCENLEKKVHYQIGRAHV